MSKTELCEGQMVKYQGKDYEVFRVMEFYVGLLDPKREPIFDEQKRLCAHIAVPRVELERGDG